MAANTPTRSKSRARHRNASNSNGGGRTRRRTGNRQKRTRRNTSNPKRQSRRREPQPQVLEETSTTLVIEVTPAVRQQWRRLSARWKQLLPKLRNGETLRESLARMRELARRMAQPRPMPAAKPGADGVGGPSSPFVTPPEERHRRSTKRYP